MEPKPPVRIATHDGSFHADEALAIAILTTIYPHHQIVRTREMDTLDWMSIVVDVGGIYDHAGKRYDHHMSNPPKGRDRHLYSSAGLIWRHYAPAYLEAIGIPKRYTFEETVIDLTAALDRHIRNQWIEPIDRNDNGLSQEMTPISVVIQSMRPTDPQKSRASYDAMFLDAVSMVSLLFKRSCFHAVDYVIAQTKHMVAEKLFVQDNQIVVTKYPIPSYRSYSKTNVHFAVFPSLECEGLDHYFIVRPIPAEFSRLPKTPVPPMLLGARREMIESLSGIKGISYIHHGGFLILADSQEAGIAFCEFCLSYK